MLQKNRVLPFGYKVENGETVIEPSETMIVLEVYNAYLNGASYKTIAKLLSEREIYYIPTRCDWNANRVKRMLENKKYMGSGVLPQIIADEIFERVQNIIRGKTANYPKTPIEFKLLQGKVICGECGTKTKRYKSYDKSTFLCQNKDCRTSITYDRLMHECEKILEKIKLAESLVPQKEEHTTTEEINYIEQAFLEELEKDELNEEKAKSLIFAQAVAKYRDLDNNVADKTESIIRDKINEDYPNSIIAIMSVSKHLLLDKYKSIKAVLLTDKKI